MTATRVATPTLTLPRMVRGKMRVNALMRGREESVAAQPNLQAP
jgi:hypothetical protein